LTQDRDFLKPLVQLVLQEVLEAEMEDTLGAGKGERAEGRKGDRSGYYTRNLRLPVSASSNCGYRRIGRAASVRRFSSAIKR